MLRRNAEESVSICDGIRTRNLFHVGRGVLPLLAVMLLATPQLAFANGLTVTVTPTLVEINEPAGQPNDPSDGETDGADNTYRVELDSTPTEIVKITVRGAYQDDNRPSRAAGGITVASDGEPVEGGLLVLTFDPEDAPYAKTVEVTVYEDADAADDQIILTHTATIGDDETLVALRNADVTVDIDDKDMKGVSISPLSLTVMEAQSTDFSVTLSSQPTATVTVDVQGASGEITVSPSRSVLYTDELLRSGWRRVPWCNGDRVCGRGLRRG